MPSCYLSFGECERLYSLVVKNGEFRAFTKLHDHAVLRLTASLRRRVILRLCDIENLCEAAFTTTALHFERIPTWGQAFSFGRIVSVSLARRAMSNGGHVAISIEEVESEPVDTGSASVAEATDFVDVLECLVRALDPAELTHLVHLVRSACLGRQNPETLATELDVCLRTMRTRRKVLIGRLRTLFAHLGLAAVLRLKQRSQFEESSKILCTRSSKVAFIEMRGQRWPLGQASDRK